MTEQKILINNLQINYKTAGEGDPLLILHGWGSSSDSWTKVIENLAEAGFKIICPDLPGFGKSQEPQYPWALDDYCDFVEKFVASLNLEKFYLLGHSFGGAVAVKYSLRFPRKVEKLFLVSAACFRRRKLRKRIFYIISKILKNFSFLPLYEKLKKGFYKFIVGGSDYPYTEGTMRETYLKIIKEDLSEVMVQIQIPTIIIWGGNDNIKPIKQAYLILEKIKNSKLEILPDIGHSPHQENPEKLSELIVKFHD